MILLFYFLNGIHHGLGADHLIAITALAGRGAGRRDISQLGLRFGLGHVGILIFLAGLALVWKLSVPSSWESRAEMVGGGLLIVLGLWTFTEWLREAGYIHSHQHRHQLRRAPHSHLHFHLGGNHPHRHLHPHFSPLLGGLFALSGIRSLLLTAVPILETGSLLSALACILIFGLGIVVSMSLYGWIAGAALSGKGQRKWITLLVSALSVTLGAYWISAS